MPRAGGFNDWSMLLPLIHKAHDAAHPGSDRKPDSKYLERLMAEALHHFNPKEFIAGQISVG